MSAPETLLVRLPNWLGDVVMTLPVIRALTAGYRVSLRGLPAFAPILAQYFPNLPYDALPAKQSGYYRHFWRYRGQFHHAVLFTNSERGDWETVISGVKHRYAIAWPERKRRLINHRYPIEHPEKGMTLHQTQLWAEFTEAFKLHQGISLQPFAGTAATTNTFILICGSENSPEKRWSVARYRELIMKLLLHYPHSQIRLTGSKNDREITDAVARGLPKDRVCNLAGETSLSEFFSLLRQAKCVIGNDTGGLHLANACAIPTVGLFGPTNPQRTAPVFDALKAVIQPPGCPATGGGDINNISADTVFTVVKELIR